MIRAIRLTSRIRMEPCGLDACCHCWVLFPCISRKVFLVRIYQGFCRILWQGIGRNPIQKKQQQQQQNANR